MQCNIGKTDRLARLAVGVLVLGIGLLAHSWWGIVGLVPLATGFVRFCPAYKLIGFSSDK